MRHDPSHFRRLRMARAGARVPFLVTALPGVKAVACGGGFTVALLISVPKRFRVCLSQKNTRSVFFWVRAQSGAPDSLYPPPCRSSESETGHSQDKSLTLSLLLTMMQAMPLSLPLTDDDDVLIIPILRMTAFRAVTPMVIPQTQVSASTAPLCRRRGSVVVGDQRARGSGPRECRRPPPNRRSRGGGGVRCFLLLAVSVLQS